jgi:hypothetical protein
MLVKLALLLLPEYTSGLLHSASVLAKLLKNSIHEGH